jgi:hypothetical protein
MAFERSLPAVPPQYFTADGTQYGVVTIGDTSGFRVKQNISLVSNAVPSMSLQVKRVLSPTQLIVGPIDNKITKNNIVNISSFKVSDSAYIFAQEQGKVNIPDDDHYKAIYESDPVVADRVVVVDKYGRKIDTIEDSNGNVRLAVDGQFTAEVDVSVDVDTNGVGPDADTIAIVDNITGTPIKVNDNGSIDVNIISGSGIHETVNIFNSISSVVSNISTLLCSYTVPMGKKSALNLVEVSGDNIAMYDVVLGNNTIARKRTYFGGDLNETFDFRTSSSSLYILQPGDVLQVFVTHYRPFVGNFECRILTVEIME